MERDGGGMGSREAHYRNVLALVHHSCCDDDDAEEREEDLKRGYLGALDEQVTREQKHAF